MSLSVDECPECGKTFMGANGNAMKIHHKVAHGESLTEREPETVAPSDRSE